MRAKVVSWFLRLRVAHAAAIRSVQIDFLAHADAEDRDVGFLQPIKNLIERVLAERVDSRWPERESISCPSRRAVGRPFRRSASKRFDSLELGKAKLRMRVVDFALILREVHLQSGAADRRF